MKRNKLWTTTLTYPVEREEITYKRKKAKGKRQAILAQFDS
ncbi:transposase, partial [Streptococcus pneumoniae]|nr:transposase [Streptococcus pneumoniae]